KSWPAPGKLRVEGVRYRGFDPQSPSSAASRLRWLGLEPKFQRQPYVQLAQVLRINGDDAGARRVLARADELASSGSPPVVRLMARVYRLAPFVALLAIGSTFVWYRRRLRTGFGVHEPTANFEPMVDLPDPPRRRRATGPLEPEERTQKA